MKLSKLILLSLVCLTFVGCVTYPENYTYSPTVTMSGNNQSSAPPILPNPFARAQTPTPIYSYTQIPNPLTTYVSPPPMSANYYPSVYCPQETYVFVTP